MARPERFELPTTKFVAWYSIQLSYGRVIRRLAGKKPRCAAGPVQRGGGLFCVAGISSTAEPQVSTRWRFGMRQIPDETPKDALSHDRGLDQLQPFRFGLTYRTRLWSSIW